MMPELIGLLRNAAYAARLVDVAHMPPLPILLVEVLARGGTPHHVLWAAERGRWPAMEMAIDLSLI